MPHIWVECDSPLGNYQFFLDMMPNFLVYPLDAEIIVQMITRSKNQKPAFILNSENGYLVGHQHLQHTTINDNAVSYKRPITVQSRDAHMICIFCFLVQKHSFLPTWSNNDIPNQVAGMETLVFGNIFISQNKYIHTVFFKVHDSLSSLHFAYFARHKKNVFWPKKEKYSKRKHGRKRNSCWNT